MATETQHLTDALKQALRARGIKYRDVAEALNLSIASVKRCFSESNFTLDRLERICDLIDMNFFELAKFAQEDRDKGPDELSLEQETALAANPALMLVFKRLLDGWDALQVCAEYHISEDDLTQLLIQLDRLRVIDLLPENRIKLLTARIIRWRNGGPIRRMFESIVKQEFLRADFSDPAEIWSFEVGELSESSQAQFQLKLDQLLNDYRELMDVDRLLPAERRTTMGVLVALRPLKILDPAFDENRILES